METIVFILISIDCEMTLSFRGNRYKLKNMVGVYLAKFTSLDK